MNEMLISTTNINGIDFKPIGLWDRNLQRPPAATAQQPPFSLWWPTGWGSDRRKRWLKCLKLKSHFFMCKLYQSLISSRYTVAKSLNSTSSQERGIWRTNSNMKPHEAPFSVSPFSFLRTGHGQKTVSAVAWWKCYIVQYVDEFISTSKQFIVASLWIDIL